MKLSAEEKRRLQSGDITCIKQVLSRELEDVKTQLLTFRPTSAEYDNILKGRAAVVKELLELLG